MSRGRWGVDVTDEARLYEVSNVHGHLLDLSGVEHLDLSHGINILRGDKVDSNTLTTETTTTTDTVNVVLLVGGEIEVDNERNLLNVDTTGKQIGRDKDTGGSGTELLHDGVTLSLVHITVHGRDSEILLGKSLLDVLDLSSGVTEDNGLGDSDSLVKINQNIDLELLLTNVNVELLDTFQSQLILLDKDTDGVTHELGGDLQNRAGHGGRQKDDLDVSGQVLENVVDLRLETTGQHLIGLIKNEHLDLVGTEVSTSNHIKNTTGSTNDNLGTLTEHLNVLLDVGTTNTGVTVDLKEVTKGQNDLLDLQSQLTGRSQDKSLGGLDVGINVL
ncbi:hypothetical protein AWJ20_550 [Sugiyamaella lignohabitans]|uniref:Uncharacterized protein n=1 Tax=Sugiyamaella lignohabitans TaxID=796027 RepID=A0A167CZR8_9ASCO|nr:uncharacterized protein AWJ20_550 [Sugiyamaella lignohabitans]ANB12301.1 hypothetical protein AWJ20_550 [Sugiyamaella lignohabitans]